MCGLSAVTSMSDFCKFSSMRARFSSSPSTQKSTKPRHASLSSLMEWSRLCTITGLKTFSSKLPCEPANPMAASLPNTCTATIVSASDCVGFTFPGMMEEPGSFSGKTSSPIPARGPDPSQRTSLAIFISEQASVFKAPLAKTISSCAESAANLFGCDLNGSPVSSAIFAAARSANSGCELSPVPTAVPPMARSKSPGITASSRSTSLSSSEAQPPNSCPTVRGVASCKCVRPIFTTSANSRAFASMASCSRSTSGISFRICSAAAMCIAVGNVSFEDCDMLTWSLGWTGCLLPSSPPAISMARFEMTSFAFMFVCVPDPVCHTRRGKCSSSLPSMTSSAALSIRRALSGGSFPNSSLTRAAAFFRSPSARTISRGITSNPMLKWCSERSVCAPQYLSARTSISPIESDSILVPAALCPVASLAITRFLVRQSKRALRLRFYTHARHTSAPPAVTRPYKLFRPATAPARSDTGFSAPARHPHTSI